MLILYQLSIKKVKDKTPDIYNTLLCKGEFANEKGAALELEFRLNLLISPKLLNSIRLFSRRVIKGIIIKKYEK